MQPETTSLSRQFQFNTRSTSPAIASRGLHMRAKYGTLCIHLQPGYSNEYATYAPAWTNYAGNDMIASVTQYGTDRKSGNETISNSAYRYTYNLTAQFDYNRTFNSDHNLFAMVLANAWQRQQSGQYHRLTNVNLGVQASYNFMQKYYLDFSSALPYSAKLPEGNRLGFSPTVTLGWRPVKEDFFGDSAFDDLMLTLSGGIISQDMDISTDDNEMGTTSINLSQPGDGSLADLGGEEPLSSAG